mmetsp:Transcript_34042/g.77699  ORF Transcript_34042/g.77699 Transcript_34042/m.77699 type:complete len:345 (-) Transcript_34042:42-1076(-)
MSGKLPCHFFAQGRCTKGAACTFSHDPSLKGTATKPHKKTCHFFAKGGCGAGDACPYLHEKPKPKEAPRAAVSTTFVTKPVVGVVVHAKNAWGRGKPALQKDEDANANTYGTDSFTIGGDADPRAPSVFEAAEAGAGLGVSYAGLARSGLDEANIDLSAVCERDWAGEGHTEEARAQFALLSARIAASHDRECGICLESVLGKGPGGEFGLLDGCAHIFCLPCIRGWRNVTQLDKTVKRSCPLCRCESHYVIPSSFFPADEEEKQVVLDSYLRRLRKIGCKHFAQGTGECPFGTSCFYEHRYKDGSLAQATAPRLKLSEDGESYEAVKKMTLFDKIAFDVAPRR